jgi:hypothetical protein
MGTPSFALVVDGAWAELQWVFYLRFSIFLAFVSSVTAFGLSLGGHDVASLDEPFQFEPLVAGLGFLLFFFELTEIRQDGPRAHFANIWNMLDTALLAMVGVVMYFRHDASVDDTSLRAAASVLCLLSYLNLLQYLRGIDATSPLVKMLIEICINITPFMLILAIVLWGFAVVFCIFLAPGREFANVHSALFRTFLMGVLGDFDVEALDESSWPAFAKSMFVLLMCVVLIIMLNLLIALMGSSYEKVMDAFVVTQRVERLQLCVQQIALLSVVSPGSIRRLDQKMQYFHQLVPDGADALDETEWSGQLSAMKAAINASALKLGAEQASQASRLDRLEEMLGEMIEIQSKQGEKLDRLLESSTDSSNRA